MTNGVLLSIELNGDELTLSNLNVDLTPLTDLGVYVEKTGRGIYLTVNREDLQSVSITGGPVEITDKLYIKLISYSEVFAELRGLTVEELTLEGKHFGKVSIKQSDVDNLVSII